MRAALALCLLSGLALAQRPPPLARKEPALRVLPRTSAGLEGVGANECPTGVTLLTAKGAAVTVTAAGAGRHCVRTDGGLVALAANEPAVSGAAVKVRASVVNQLLNSETFNSWTAGAANLADAGVIAAPTVTANAAICNPAPDGTDTADLIDFPAVEDGAATPTGYSLVYKSYAGTAAAWSDSLWVRAADVTDGGSLPLSFGNYTASNPDNATCTAGTAYARCDLSATLSATTYYLTLGPDTRPNYSPAHLTTYPALSVCVWGAQAALGSTAVDYCGPSTTGAVTCAAELFSTANELAAAPANPGQWCIGGTVDASTQAWAAGASRQALVALGGHSGANTATLFASYASDGKPFFQVYDSTATILYVYASGAISAAKHSIYGCSNNGTLSIWVDGSAVATGAATGGGLGTIATQPATAYLGCSAGAAYGSDLAKSDWRIVRGVSP